MKKILLTLLVGSLSAVAFAAGDDARVVRSTTLPTSLYSTPIKPFMQYVPSFDTTRNLTFDVVEYPTIDTRGEEVTASGLVIYPSDGDLRGVVMAMHGTIGSDAQAPSRDVFSDIVSQVANYGYMVVMPDYIGYGSTAERVHPYLDVENTGRVSVDMLMSVKDMMTDRGMSMGNSVTVVGYSQGAAAALSFQKLAQECYGDDIKIARTFVGGGPYDPVITLGVMLKQERVEHPSLVPISIIGLNEGSNLGMNLDSVFVGRLGDNYREWVMSKNYNLGQIDSLMATNRLDSMMNMSVLDENNPASQRLGAALVRNRLTDVIPSAPIYIFHALQDTYVPIENAHAYVEALKKAGFEDYTFKTVEGDHITPLFIIDVLNAMGR